MLNDNNPTYYNIYNDYSSKLDLSLATPCISVKSQWTVLEELWGSDHYPIEMSINLRAVCNTKFKKRISLYIKRTNWDLFSRKLKEGVVPLMDLLQNNTVIEIQTLYSSLATLVESAIKVSTETEGRSVYNNNSRKNNSKNVNYIKLNRKAGGHPKSSSPWWDEKCDKLIMDRKIAYDNFKNRGNRENLNAYVKEVARVKLELRKIKREKFDRFTESLRKDSNPTFVWKKVKAFQNSLSNSDSPNSYNKCSHEAILKLIENLYPPWVSPAPSPLPQSGRNELMDLPFDYEEIEAVFNNLKIKSSPGPDNIDYYIIFHFPRLVREFLLSLYNKMLDLQQFPKE